MEKRQKAQKDLLTFASIIDIPGSPVQHSDEQCENFQPIPSSFGAHHILWLKCLQDVADGKMLRLMGLMPPGSAKSTYTSVVFPTYYLGRFPGTNIIIASYGTDLPKTFGRRARAVVKQPIYQRIFNTDLSLESSAVDAWALTNGSNFMAAGILSGITGRRVNGIIWDDLIKGREAADSLTQREKTWVEYQDSLLSRKSPYAWEVGIATRWHEDDPAGRILPEFYNGESGLIKCRDGNEWYVVCIPAIAESKDDILGRQPGERIWPEWFPPDHFNQYMGSARTWNALYQQRPAPESGDYFKAEWLKPYDTLPFEREEFHVYGASDYAVSVDQGDWTVHIVVGIGPDDNIYILDFWRRQAGSAEWVVALGNLIKKWRPMGWAEEMGQIRAAVGPFIEKHLRDNQLYVARAQFPAKGDKSVRAQSIRGRMDMRGLYYPRNAPWFPAFKHELMTFPAGKNDDQVDALGLIGQVLDRMVQGSRKDTSVKRPKVISTNPEHCTVTLDDLFLANEQRARKPNLRIH